MADLTQRPMVKKYRKEIILLHDYGYLPQYKTQRQLLSNIDQPTLDQAWHEYQILTGLEPDCDEDKCIEYRFCRLPDKAPLRATMCKWPKVDVTWHVEGELKNISENDVKASYNDACSWWNEVCTIRLRYTPNPKTADILARSANLGGPGNVLADSGLPCGKNPRQQPQRYDGENWAIGETVPQGFIDLTRVQCHELGHAIGSDHIANGNLLAPMYSPRIRKPQQGDIAEMQSRYPGQGAPTPAWDAGTTQPPVIPPPPVGGGVTTVRVTGGYIQVSGLGTGQLAIVTSGQVVVTK
jgi:hypothetical protein